MDVLAHTSFREGLPRAIPQALLCERPAVAFDCDGAREVVRNGRTGYLVPAGSTAALADTLDRLLSDQNAREAMGKEGRRMCLEMFPAGLMVDKLERVYAELLGKGGRKA